MARPTLAPNRPGSSPRFTVRATQELLDNLDRVAAATGRPRSEVLRDAVEHGLRARLEAAG